MAHLTDNKSKVIFVLNDSVRALLATFEKDDPERNTKAKREMVKTLDPSIKVGDMVNVETGSRHGVSTMKIVEADVEVNFNDPENVRWIVGKVDMTALAKVIDQENEAISAIRRAELKKERKDLRATLDESYSDEMKNIQLVHQKSDPVPVTAAVEPPADGPII